MLSPRTFLETSASRRARTSARVSRFMRSTARRMYAARESFRVAAHRLLASSRSSGSSGASPRLARVTLVLSGVALVMPGDGTLYFNPTGNSSRSPRCFAGERARSEGAGRV